MYAYLLRVTGYLMTLHWLEHQSYWSKEANNGGKNAEMENREMEGSL